MYILLIRIRNISITAEALRIASRHRRTFLTDPACNSDQGREERI